MKSYPLTFDESKSLEKYMAMSNDELIRDLNLSLLPKSNAESISAVLRGHFFFLSDIKTILDPSIISSRTILFLSETREILNSNQEFIDSLNNLLGQNPTIKELITFIYGFLENHADRRRSQMRIATYICRVGIKEFLNLKDN